MKKHFRQQICAFVAAIVTPSALHAASVIEFKFAAYEGNELGDSIQIILTCTPPPTNYTRVTLRATGGSAQEGADYSMFGVEAPSVEAPSAVTFYGDNGELEESPLFLEPADDGLPEPDETVQLSIGQIAEWGHGIWVPSSAVVGSRSNATVIIHNGQPSVSFAKWPSFRGSTELSPVSEAGGDKMVRIYRYGDTNDTVTVEYRTADDTARAGVDYVAQSGNLTFAAGQRSASLSIPILDNGRVDGDRELRIALTNASPGAAILAGEGRVAIADNEIPVAWDRTFQPDPSLQIGGPFAIQPDGKIIATGRSGDTNVPPNVAAFQLYRLHPNGGVDASFRSPTLYGGIGEIILDSQGRIYVTPSQNPQDNGLWTGIIRLNPEGALDTGFVTDYFTLYGPGSLAFQSDGRLLITDSGRIHRLNREGSSDATFTNLPPLSFQQPIAVTTGDRILIASQTTHSTNAPLLFRLEPNGQLDISFHTPLFDSQGDGRPYISSLKVQPDGRILIAGRFSFIDGQLRANVARLNADGTVDATFTPSPGTDAKVDRIACDALGRVIINCAGLFTRVNGWPRKTLARFLPDGRLDLSFVGPDFGETGLLARNGRVSKSIVLLSCRMAVP